MVTVRNNLYVTTVLFVPRKTCEIETTSLKVWGFGSEHCDVQINGVLEQPELLYLSRLRRLNLGLKWESREEDIFDLHHPPPTSCNLLQSLELVELDFTRYHEQGSRTFVLR